MNSLAHVEINVTDVARSADFWERFLAQLGWERFDAGHADVVGFRAPDRTHIFLAQTERRFLDRVYHRKQVGLNHVAFSVDSSEAVDEFSGFLKAEDIPMLYHDEPKDYSSQYAVERYYAVFFEDPDRIKVEVVYMQIA